MVPKCPLFRGSTVESRMCNNVENLDLRLRAVTTVFNTYMYMHGNFFSMHACHVHSISLS